MTQEIHDHPWHIFNQKRVYIYNRWGMHTILLQEEVGPTWLSGLCPLYPYGLHAVFLNRNEIYCFISFLSPSLPFPFSKFPFNLILIIHSASQVIGICHSQFFIFCVRMQKEFNLSFKHLFISGFCYSQFLIKPVSGLGPLVASVKFVYANFYDLC